MKIVLKNTAVCVIIIPGVVKDSELGGLVAPGEQITVPVEVANTDFVKNLINIGELDLVDEIEDEDDEEPPVVDLDK